MAKGTFYPNNPKVEWLYQKSIILQEFILFKLFRLKPHPNNIGVHFFLPLKPYHVFTLDLYYIRLNLYFPFFVSFSIGELGAKWKGCQLYFGLKYGVEPTDRYNGEYDYMISMSFRRNLLGKSDRIKNMGTF